MSIADPRPMCSRAATTRSLRSGPTSSIRQTADNPFPDPTVAAAQVERLVDGGFDYVGIDGWPLGIAAETCRMAGLALAAREATDAADREHVMPFLYRQPERFRVGRLERPEPATPDRPVHGRHRR